MVHTALYGDTVDVPKTVVLALNVTLVIEPDLVVADAVTVTFVPYKYGVIEDLLESFTVNEGVGFVGGVGV